MQLNKTRHRTIIFQILKNIYQDTEMAPVLGLKGGTAASLFYELPRFSVDLDFDLLDESKENLVFDRMVRIAKKYGVIKDEYKKRFNLFCALSYEAESHKIKLEVNRRRDSSKFELKQYLGVPMLVMTKEDMFANKLMAMYNRIQRTSRDIYDVWYFLDKRWALNEKLIEEKMAMPIVGFWEACLTELEKFDNALILNGLGELLDESQKDWVKAKLKEELIFLLRLRVDLARRK